MLSSRLPQPEQLNRQKLVLVTTCYTYAEHVLAPTYSRFLLYPLESGKCVYCTGQYAYLFLDNCVHNNIPKGQKEDEVFIFNAFNRHC